jgi:PAS domain-containing protein
MNLRSLDDLDWQSLADLGSVPDTVWAAAVAALVTLGLVAVLAPRRGAEPAEPATAGEADAAVCEFLVNGSTLRPTSGAARALLESLGGRKASIQALSAHLERDCPPIAEDLEALVLYGAAFRRTCQRPDGSSFEIVGRPRGGAAILTIRAASPEARALDEAERALARAGDEAAFLRQALDRAPVLAWTLAPGGQVAWANAAYRERFDHPEMPVAVERQSCAFAHLIEEVPLTARSEGETRRRVKVAARRDGDPHWFELSQVPLATGETLSYAVEVDDLVAAEASLRRFVETLTETFAHLPIGLAVFDKNRRLGLFNPALSDLVKIDAVWLAGRPSLRDFLERLRETRQMPEQKDFAAFRRMLTELEEGARDGTYEENWQLPSGKIFRVTGRPHPQGALAFLFEDISPAILLERRYRGELELSQATLDRMSEAVAVFDTSGMLVFVNSAFETLWGLDPMESLDGPKVGELAALWEARCRPSPLWGELSAFATGADNRTSWTGSVERLEGGPLAILVAPLPNGSTLVTFREMPDASLPAPLSARPGEADALRRGSLVTAAALAEIEGPAEAALAAFGAALGAAPDARAFGGLMLAAQGLKDGLARARALQAELEGGSDAGEAGQGETALADRLAALLAARGLRLGAVLDQGDAQADGVDRLSALGAALPGLAMAAAAVARGETTVELSIANRPDAAGLALHVPASVPEPGERESALLAIARRRVERAGGCLEVRRDGEGVTLALRAPPAGAPVALAAAG